MTSADHSASPAPMSLFQDPLRGEELALLYKDIWRLAIPTFIGQGLQAVVLFVSRIIVGNLGDKAFNSVNLGMLVFMVIITVVAAVAVGATALIAQAWGSGDRKRAAEILQQSLMWGMFLALIIAVVGTPASRFIFRAMGADAETRQLGHTFMLWLFAGIPLMVIGFFLSAGLRAAGDARTPMWSMLIMGVLSLILSYGLILGRWGMPRLGTLGAALALDGAFTAMTVFLGALFLTNRSVIKLPLRGWKLDLKTGITIFRIGMPSAMEWILIQVGILAYTKVIYYYGDQAVAGYFTGVALLTFAQTPAFGFQTASATLVGQSIGAGQLERAESVFRRCALMGFLFMVAIGGFLLAMSHPGVLKLMFGKLSDESLLYAREFSVLLVLVMPLMGVSFSIAGGLRGAADTVSPLVASAVGVYGGRILFAFALYYLFHPPVLIVWCSMFPDLILRILLMAFRLRSGKWKRARHFKSPALEPAP